MKSGYITTAQYFKNAGTIWLFLGIFASIIADLELTNFIFNSSETFWYGKLKPFYTNIIIFGSIVSYFLSALYYHLDRLKVNQIKPSLVGRILFAIYQFALLFGLFTLILGKGEGRIYGELNFISDNLIIFVFLAVLIKTLIHLKNSEELSAIFQYLIVNLSGMIVTFFLGNFGFPNSYITTVPLTSGFQDAMITEFYKNSVLVYFVLLPLNFILFSFITKFYNVSNTIYFSSILIIISILIPFSSGANLQTSPYQNFWTSIGSYVLIGILLLILGINYYLHTLYQQYKLNNNFIVFSISGFLLFVFTILMIISQIPILQKYIQFTVMDISDFGQKSIYILLPIFLVYNMFFYNDKSQPTSLMIMLIIVASLAFIVYIVQAVVVSKSLYGLTDKGELLIKDWSTIISKEKIFIYIRIVLEALILCSTIYLIKYPFSNKISEGENL